jgi:Protein of unknown function (DUF1499)
MDTRLILLAAAAVLVIVLLALSAFFRKLLAVTIRLAIFLGLSSIAIGATAVLINGETIFAPPGTTARVTRFLTVDYAATSRKGLGDVACAAGQEGGAARAAPESGAKPDRPQAPALAAPASAENLYPELVTRGYPGIGPARLFEMARDTVNGLRGWKVIRSDPSAGTLDCLYTSRIFGFEDNIKLVVTPFNEIEVCSRSKAGTPGSDLWPGFFHGDFGANMGNIKEFYAALEPRVDAVYRTRQQQ